MYGEIEMRESGKTEMGDNSLVSQKLAIRELARNLIIKKYIKRRKTDYAALNILWTQAVFYLSHVINFC